ncbi:MAG: hypothetical protein JJ885_12915 [Muricauda sp.]|nr:hypothetical protein [Allomuricauda sp.]MBO6590192.1 hypothetical protein [Allomuricauda sp.]MBO6619660.1 hypothetical protein [Allomuricauda sp.]MBO6645713.1 hypothetical protein [Allomuricauda sp.]MBO6747998.1 hypothetical protein [Allomuricauda sp.]MBO6845238.1 hypothetical protein [Allomuricauda sp.]
MSKIEFVKLENQNNEGQIVTGIFFNEGKPIAYGHFNECNARKDGLCLAFKKGELNNTYLSNYVLAFWESTGVFLGLAPIRVTENDNIVDFTIERWRKQFGTVA